MPEVDGKKYPYTKKGKAAAKVAKAAIDPFGVVTGPARIAAAAVKNMKKRKAKVEDKKKVNYVPGDRLEMEAYKHPQPPMFGTKPKAKTPATRPIRP